MAGSLAGLDEYPSSSDAMSEGAWDRDEGISASRKREGSRGGSEPIDTSIPRPSTKLRVDMLVGPVVSGTSCPVPKLGLQSEKGDIFP